MSGGTSGRSRRFRREQPFLEARHVDNGEPGAGRRFRRWASLERRAVRPAGAADPTRHNRRSAVHHPHATAPGRLVLSRAHRLPVAAPATAARVPAVADGVRVHANLREPGRLGDDAPSPRDDAARAGRSRGQPDRRDHRHAKREDDRKGGPRGYDAAKKVKGRKRHIAVDSTGLLLGVTVHAADVQDADGAADLLRRLKRLYPWLKAVFADSVYDRVYDRVAVLLACFLLGLTLIVVRRIAGTIGFVLLP